MSIDVNKGLLYGIHLTADERKKVWNCIDDAETEMLLEENMWAQSLYAENDWDYFIGTFIETDFYVEITSLTMDFDEETQFCIDYVEKALKKHIPRKMYLITRWW